MAVTYGFFNSMNGDRKYNADQISEYFEGIVSQGVFQSLNSGMAVSAGTGLTVNVAAGRAIVQNHWIKNDATLTLDISAASTTYARIDAVVLRFSSSNRNITIAVKTGTPAASPSAPSMTRSGGTYEMALAYVNVAANATSVTVTDKRSDTSVCGWAAVAQSIDGTYEAMIDDIKTGFDGVVYPSPGAAVRGCDQKLDGKIDEVKSSLDSYVSVDRTVNLFDKNAISNYYGYSSTGVLRGDGTPDGVQPNNFVSDWIEVDASTEYYYTKNSTARITEFDSSKNFVNNISPSFNDSFTTTATTAYIRFTISNNSNYENTFMITLRTDQPDHYIPYYTYTINNDIIIPQLTPRDQAIALNESKISILQKDIGGYLLDSGKYWKNHGDDTISKASFENLNALERIEVSKGDSFYIYTKGHLLGDSYFICDDSINILSSSGNDEVNEIVTVTNDNAKYLYVNVYYTYLSKYKVVKISTTNLADLTIQNKNRISELEDERGITICCTGDSVTQGMDMDGSQTAEYGKSPYPARLTTLLVDEGYTGIIVYNQGHGGERMPDVAARLGGKMCYVAEDITIPSNNDWVSLGQSVISDHQITGTKLKINYKNISNTDYNVYFTQLSSDTNPVYIDGVPYAMKVKDNTNYIRKVTADGKSTVIKNGTMVFTNGYRCPSVNIIFAGYNGHQSLTCEKWIDLNRSCAEVNGGKYIIIGSTIAIWEDWSDITGLNSAEKYADYKAKTYDAFGIHFLDLYTDFFDHALSYALAAGYFSDLSSEELAQMETLLLQHILPAEFSYDGEHQGNVHLNEAGYHVIALLLLDRLKRLDYIPKSPQN